MKINQVKLVSNEKHHLTNKLILAPEDSELHGSEQVNGSKCEQYLPVCILLQVHSFSTHVVKEA